MWGERERLNCPEDALRCTNGPTDILATDQCPELALGTLEKGSHSTNDTGGGELLPQEENGLGPYLTLHTYKTPQLLDKSLTCERQTHYTPRK